jgi:transcription initiation factor TFIIIB Brf1 subunit/transcription initiation factor TFIIB
VCKKNSAHPRQVARLARKIAAFFRKPWVLSQRNITQEVEKYCSQLGVHRTFTSSAIQLSDAMHRMAEERYVTANSGYLAACIYLTGRLLKTVSIRTQAEISEVCNVTEVTLRNNLLVILKMVNTERGDLEGISFEDFMTGVREVCRKEE